MLAYMSIAVIRTLVMIVYSFSTPKLSDIVSSKYTGSSHDTRVTVGLRQHEFSY